MVEQRIKLAQMDTEQAAREIGEFMVNQILAAGSTGGVIGLSGGVDSTATAALAKKGFDDYNAHYPGTNLELVGYLLPSKTNDPKDEEDGAIVAKRLGIRYEVQNIETVVEAYRTTNPEAFQTNFDKGNLMSRIRANILSTKAATEKKTLLGTGNKDEDFGIGYYTLFGDGAVHMSPIGALPKRLVREMARYLGFRDLADRIPTAGLEPGQTDFKDLGYGYDLVEIVTEGYAQGIQKNQLMAHSQVAPLARAQMQQYETLYGVTKFQCVDDMVNDILRRHERVALPKAQIVHPPIAPVTLRYV